MSDPSRRLAPVVRLAPAKLNLTLAVVGRRPDGFHALHSVFVPLALADRLSLAPLPAGPDSLHLTGLAVPGADGDNLVLRAIRATREAVRRTGLAAPSLAARLDKRLPVAAGLGGGSSDAAAAIDGALEAWGAELDAATRAGIAATLGSDVPFFLAGGAPALVQGRGERVEPLRGVRGGGPAVLLVTPALAVPTGDVFARFVASGAAGSGSTRLTSEHLAAELGRGLARADLLARAGVLAVANDLWPATSALAPVLVPFRRALLRLLGRPVGLSGSGPTFWALYPSLDDAEAAASDTRRAAEDGRLSPAGQGPPFVAATTIATTPVQPSDEEDVR